MVQMNLVDATSRNCHLRMRGSGQEESDCTKWASCPSCNLGMYFVFFFRHIVFLARRWHHVAPPVRCPAGGKFYLGQECNSEGKVCASYLTLRFRFVDQENRALYIAL